MSTPLKLLGGIALKEFPIIIQDKIVFLKD